MSEENKNEEKRCSVCGRNESECGKLIRMTDELMICDDCMQRSIDTVRSQTDLSELTKNMPRLKRAWRFLSYFPSECLWEPVFRWYHFFWRLRHH